MASEIKASGVRTMHLFFSETFIASIRKVFAVAGASLILVGLILLFGLSHFPAKVFGMAMAMLSVVCLWGWLRVSWLKQTKAAAVIATEEEVIFNSPLSKKRVRFEDLASVGRLVVAPHAGPATGKLPMEVIRLTRKSGGNLQVPLTLLSGSASEVESWMSHVRSRVIA